MDDSNWYLITSGFLGTTDPNCDSTHVLPAALAGQTLTFRVRDRDRTPEHSTADGVSVDERFLRSIP